MKTPRYNYENNFQRLQVNIFLTGLPNHNILNRSMECGEGVDIYLLLYRLRFAVGSNSSSLK